MNFEAHNYDVNKQEERDVKLDEAAKKYANERIDERMTKITCADLTCITSAIDAGKPVGEYIATCVSYHMTENLMSHLLQIVRADVWQDLYADGYVEAQKEL